MNTEEEVNKLEVLTRAAYQCAVETFKHLLKILEDLSKKSYELGQQSQSADVAEKKGDKDEEIKTIDPIKAHWKEVNRY